MSLSQGHSNGVSTMPCQLTFQDREKISQMLFSKASDAEIAAALGRSRSTIFRERTRNACNQEYSAVQAQQQSEKRRSNRPLTKLLNHGEFRWNVWKCEISCFYFGLTLSLVLLAITSWLLCFLFSCWAKTWYGITDWTPNFQEGRQPAYSDATTHGGRSRSCSWVPG